MNNIADCGYSRGSGQQLCWDRLLPDMIMVSRVLFGSLQVAVP